jgi:monoamine oxidase
MPRFTRRSFLAGSAALTARPALAQRGPAPPPPPDDRFTTDAVIIGAGAAGIAAARRLVAAGRRVVVLEAGSQAGGRCVTDTTIFGVPYDRGAHWIYTADINPLAKLAPAARLDIYPAPPGQRVRLAGRYTREGETEDYLATLVRANNAIAEIARTGKADISCAQALPKDLGDWRPTIEFFLGPFGCGKDLADVSATDFARGLEHDNSAFCRQGYGALLANLAGGLPIQLGAPATRIDWGIRAGVDVESERGRIAAATAIVTVSTNVLVAEKIKFVPDLPRRHLDAANKLKLGSYDHITLELPGNPLGLRQDELVFEKATNRTTASLFAYAGTTLCTVDVAGSFGRDLSAKGEREMITFALDWLTRLYGSDVKNIVKRRHASRWNAEPFVLGAASSAAPGAQPLRKVLMEPLNNRVFFAGEAAHETLWGTVGGAWESGERAADAVIKATERPTPPIGRR